MHSAARVLIVGQCDDSDGELLQSLQSNGFEMSRCDIRQSASEVAGRSRPDVVILNLQSDEARANPGAFLALAKALKQSALSSRMRIMLIGSHTDVEIQDIETNVDDLLIGPINADQICHRLKSLVRLNTMHEELVRRLNTTAKYGIDAPVVRPPEHVNNPTILVFGEALDYAAVENALAKHATLVSALSESTALDYLGRSMFDAVLINAGDELASYLSFVRDIRRNSKMYNLPVILLADRSLVKDTPSIFEAGVTDILTKPLVSQEVCVRINALVRELRFRDTLKTVYREARHFATSDALTGLYSRGFLFEHLSNVIADAQRTTQGFSVAGLSVRNLPEINTSLGYVAGDRIIRQVGEVVGLLIRGEDLAARYSGSKFVVILPDTDDEHAVHAVERIAGVVGHTEFVVEGHDHPVSAALTTSIEGYRPGDSAEALIERLWRPKVARRAAA